MQTAAAQPNRRILLRSTQFRLEREDSWRELEMLVSQVEKHGLDSLSAPATRRLPMLYRAALSSLSVARAISLDRGLQGYLEALTARAYLAVYGTRTGLGATLWDFLRAGFPQAVRSAAGLMLLAALFLFLGVGVGWYLTAQNLDMFYTLVDSGMAGGRGPASTPEELREGLYPHDAWADGALLTFSSFLFTHNARIGMLAFALGFAFGIPVVYLMVANGLIIGSFLALFEAKGLLPDFAAWLSIHGVTELLAVVMCGGAGLVIGRTLAAPGRQTRLVALAQAGRRAGLIVIGAVGLFLIAGIIEGVFRQTVTTIEGRVAFAAATGAFWLWYFSMAGRRRAQQPDLDGDDLDHESTGGRRGDDGDR